MSNASTITVLRQKITYMQNLVAKSSITPPIVAEIMNLLADLNETLKGLVDSNASSTTAALEALEAKLTKLCAKSVSVANFAYVLESVKQGDTISYSDSYTGSAQLQPPPIVYYVPDKHFYGVQIAYAASSDKAAYTFYKSFPGEDRCMDENSPKKDSIYVDSENQLYYFKGDALTRIGLSNDDIETVLDAVDTLSDFTAEIRNVSGHDLAFADESGNVVMSVTGGHIKTKNFNSSSINVEQPVKTVTIPELEEGETSRPAVDGATFVADGDLAIADESGNIVVLFGQGHIRTKNFDSSQFDPDVIRNQETTGLRISFLGDSITTFDGYIPSGYLKYYPSGDVSTVDKCYWKRLAVYLPLATPHCCHGIRETQEACGHSGRLESVT